MSCRRIGILTGGGDVPGLNSVIKSVVYRGTENDCEAIGIRRGWEGLTHLDFDDPASVESGAGRAPEKAARKDPPAGPFVGTQTTGRPAKSAVRSSERPSPRRC